MGSSDREVLFRTDPSGQYELATLLRKHEPELTIKGIEQWRSGQLPLTEILVGLTSAGSLASISAVLAKGVDSRQTWTLRTREPTHRETAQV